MGFRGLAEAGRHSQSPIWRWLVYRLREKEEMLPGRAWPGGVPRFRRCDPPAA